MAVEVTLSNTNGTIGEIVDYSVSEDATPLVIGESAGSVGQIEVTARALETGPIHKRSGSVVGGNIHLSDTLSIPGTRATGRGDIDGTITNAAIVGPRVNLTAETVLNRLNTDRRAKPFYGVYTPPQTSTSTRTNVATNPSRELNLDNIFLDAGSGNVGGAATLSRATETGWSGYYARVTYTSNGTAVGGGMYEQVPIVGGTSYSLQGQYRVTRAATVPVGTPAQTLRFLMRFFTSGGATLNTTEIAGVVQQGEWTKFTISAEAPANAAYAHIFTVAGNAGATMWRVGDTIDSDLILVEAGAGGEYFDGSTPTVVVVDEETGVETRREHSWLGTPNASASIETIYTTVPANGYDATEGSAFRYYCELVDIYNVTVDADFENRPVAYPSWEGNVWTYLKDFAAAVGGEIALVDGSVTLRKPRTYDVPLESISGPAVSVTTALTSQFVEVVNQNSRWGTNETVLDSDSQYSVEAGGYTEAVVTVPHHLTSVNSPVPVAKYARDYMAGKGQYAVIDSQGVSVPPAWWQKNGGAITASLVRDSYNEILIQIYGPSSGDATYTGPFKISRFVTPSSGTEQGEQSPALTITGSGVLVAPENIRIRTGAGASDTSTVVGSVINNIFLSTASLAYTRGLDAACAAAGPVVKMSGTINHFTTDGQQFGVLTGGRIKFAGNIFRITNTQSGRDGVSISGLADMTFSDMIDLYSYTFESFNSVYPTLSFTAFNTLMGSKTFQEFNEQTPTPNFTFFNDKFEGASFSNHATYPYTGGSN